MSITILNPGMLTSVQDLGRIGYQQFGVSVSGVMDPRSRVHRQHSRRQRRGRGRTRMYHDGSPYPL